MDVAITEVDAEVDDDDVEPDEKAAQEEEDDDTLTPTNDSSAAAVSADMEAIEVESEEEDVGDTAEHVEVAIEAVDGQTVETFVQTKRKLLVTSHSMYR